MADDQEDFRRFMQEREAAARAYVNGDAGPLGRLATRTSPATFFGPRGGSLQGAAEVFAVYESDAGAFEHGGETSFDILQMGAGGGIGYWTGFQRADVRLRGQSAPVAMNLRVTEIFRREEEGWKLVHRHADMLADALA
jgi:ketosteroid isomerase-like protein